jgi:hypothetical protein
MRFRSRGQPRGLMLARERRRMTLVLGGAVLVAVAVTLSGKSAWLTQMFSQEPAPVPKSTAVAESLLGNNDLQSDEFLFVPNESADGSRDYAKMIDRVGAAQMETVRSAGQSGFGEVPEKLTRTIRDDVIGVLSTEAEAWFGTLRLAERISPEQQLLLPEGQFSLFMDSPQSCRGKAYTIRGRLRRLIRAPLPSSAETFGVKSAYDAWISTRDSGNELVHVVALSADPGLPLTEHTGKTPPDVELTGYFFKREGYAAKGSDGQGELALTPLLLASRIRFVPVRTIVTRADEMNPWLMWISIGVCCGVLVLIWQFQTSDRVFRGTRTHQLTILPVKASFEGVEAITVQQALRDMQENAQHSAPDTSLLS